MNTDSPIVAEPVRAALEASTPQSGAILACLEAYPTSVLETLIYHRLFFHLDPAVALASYRQLGTVFVDLNEIRVSPIREIQEQVNQATDSLELSVFIKDLLEFTHSDRHEVDLEFIIEQNITDIRRYLKRIRNLENTSVDVLLARRKGYPVVALSAPMEATLVEAGLLVDEDSKDRRQKALHSLVGQDAALAFHHLVLEACRTPEVDDDKLESAFAFVSTITGKTVKPKGRRKAKKSATGAAKKASKTSSSAAPKTKKKTSKKTTK